MSMTQDAQHALAVLTEHAREIVAGSYKNVRRIFALTDKSVNAPEIAELAEAFGMMSVKVEAREYALEQTIEELRKKKTELEEAVRLRESAGYMFIVFSLFIGFYNFVVAIISRPVFRQAYGPSVISWFGILFIVCLMVICALGIRRSGLPPSAFGLNLKNARRALVESMAVTVVIIAGFVAYKIWAIDNLPAYQGRSLLQWKSCSLFFWLYIVAAPAQEFTVRGTVQTSVERVMCGRHRGFWAVVTTSVLFGVCHTFYSIPLAISSLVAGLIWGWLYLRHRTILGISISHFLIGNALELLEFGLIVPSCS